MANKRPSEVTYRPLRVDPIIQDGLLRVDRPDGGPERRVAEAFGRVAYQADQIADELRAGEGKRDAEALVRENGPRPSEISGGVSSTYEPGSTEPMAYSGGGGGGGGTPRASTGGGDLAARGKYMYDGLRQRGLSHVAAAAGVGHARQESSLQAAGPDGDKGTSSGAWQWRNERRAALQRFASGGGKNWRDIDTQMDFFVHELKTSEKLAWNRLQSATDITSATEALMHFERPQHYTAKAPRRGHGWDNRLAHAQWASAFGSDSAPAPAAVAASPAPAATSLSATPPATGAAAAIDAIAPRGGTAPAAASAATAIAPASVGPPSVTRVVEPVSISGGQRGTFRPKSDLTIYGRAYNAAGTRTYLEQLDNTIRADTDEVYRRFKDDPAALDAAFGALRTVHMQDHVFPEVAADYDRAFSSVTRAYRTQARDDADKRVLMQDKADFLVRSQDMATMTARTVEAFDPANADAGAAVASAQSASDAHFDSAVARGIIDPVSAAEYKADNRRRTATAFYLKQASVLTDADQVRDLRDKMSADFAAGTMEGLDGEGWQDLNAKLETLAGQRLREGEAAGRALEKRGDALAAGVARGLPSDSAEVSQFMLDANSAPAGAEAVRSSLAKMRVAELLTSQELDTSETMVRALEQDPAAIQSGVASFGRTMLDEARTKLAKDPIGYAVQRGMIADTPAIDPMAAPDQMAAAFASRAEAVTNLQAAEPSFEGAGALRPAEVDAFQRFWRAGSPEQIAVFTEQMVAGLPPRVLRATLDQAGVKDVLKSAATGTDAHRNFEAMKTIGGLAAGSGIAAVQDVFGADVLDRYQDWESRTRYGTTEEAADFLKQRNDPAWNERVRPARDAGRKKAREVSFEDIADGLDPTWFGADAPIDGPTRRMMQNDFVQIYGDRYAVSQDEGKARDQAFEQMKAKGWSVSPTLGGRLMFQPPERFYPLVQNSYDWMKAQLSEFATGRGVDPAQMTLVPDERTQAAIQRKEGPTYSVLVVDPETGLDRAMTDDGGKALRVGFDAARAIRAASEAGAAAKARLATPRPTGRGNPADVYERQRAVEDERMKGVIAERARRAARGKEIDALMRADEERKQREFDNPTPPPRANRRRGGN